MEPVPRSLLRAMDFEAAVEEECSAVRNQIPPEPWYDAIRARKKEVARWVRGRLESGMSVVPSLSINARKASLGTRPVPIMGIGERVAYRAFASYVLREIGFPDRSIEAYQTFIRGPVDAAFSAHVKGTFFKPGGARFSHVVETDVAAFYQYVDHHQLGHQLELMTGEINATEVLVQLLRETERRVFGLPQLIDASDWLSDFYIQHVERDMIRRGYEVWRFNDDFRIGCGSFTEALDAIERLEEAARSIGLTLTDSKTYTPRFSTYYFQMTGMDLSEVDTQFDPTEVEPIAMLEYMEADEAERIEAALETLGRLDADDDDHINLERPSADDLRQLRRSVGSLLVHQDAGGLPHVKKLFAFVPSLTPRVCEYLIVCHNQDPAGSVEEIIDDLLETHSLGEWQALWISYVLRVLDLVQDSDDRTLWLLEQRERGRGRPLGAEAALALATGNRAEFDDLDMALRTEPQALAPWFLLAIQAMATEDPNTYRKRAGAIRDSDPLHAVLIDI